MDKDVVLHVARQHLRNDEMDACEKQCNLLANSSEMNEDAKSLLVEFLVKKGEFARASCCASRLLKVSWHSSTSR